MVDQPGGSSSGMRRLMEASTRKLALVALLVGVVVLASTSVSGLVLYVRAVDALISEVRTDVLRQALSAAAALEVDLLERLNDPEQENGPDYRLAVRPLDRIRLASPDVRFIYTCAMRDGQVCFVLDPTPPGDADKDGIEDHSSLFEPYPDANPILRGVIASGVAATDEVPVPDKWGTTFSGYAPLRDSRGKLVGVLGVDLAVQTYDERIHGMRGAAWSGGLLALLCSTLVGVGCYVALAAVRQSALISRERLNQLGQAREQAERADRAKGDFLAMMSHEIRTPLNAVIGLADLLVSSGLEGQQREHAETIRASGEHLLAMINDILDYSKIEAGRMELVSAPFSPAAVSEQAVRLLTEAAKAKGLRLDLELAADLPPAVLGDQVRLRQALINLIGNAVKFTALGGVRVMVSTGVGEGAIRFAVTDTGIGIDRATLDQLFQPFQQAAGAHGGSGLGLVISQRLVRLMGGEIMVESAPGTGSAFSFCVTFAKAPATAYAPTASSLHPPRFSGRVLVVDDQSSNRVVANAMLSRLGLDCEAVESGAAALLRLRQGSFDLVLMDVQMPERGGLQTTADLRLEQASTGRHTPVVALTAATSAEDERVCRAAGMDGYLAKPLRIEALAGELERWLPVVRDGLPPAEFAPPPLASVKVGGEAAVMDLRVLATLRLLDSDPRGFIALVDGYLADARRQLAAMAAAMADGRSAELARLAHGQRGAALTMGLAAFATVLSTLEAAAQASDREAMANALSAVEREFLRAATVLASVRGQG